MRALALIADRKLELADVPSPPPPAADEVQIRVKAVALNHLDLWGYRGMAFAKRKMPVVVGAEAAGEIAALGSDAAPFKPGEPVVMYGAMTCGTCRACREGRDNLCENVGGIMGFHIDGFARDLVNMPARLVIPVPPGVAPRDAACAPIAFATVQHMLFDNARLEPGETVLVHAGGSGIGTAAIIMAKAIGCTVITTVGDDAKAEKARALGADHVINYQTDRFEGVVRKLTGKKGVDVVFEHVGAQTFNGSLLCLKRGGRLVTCGECKACREGRDNLCEEVPKRGIMGFHIDGFARELINMPARLTIKVPDGVSLRDAACAPIAFATVTLPAK